MPADSFTGNTAGLFAGAINADRSDLLVTNSLFVLNSAGNQGDVLRGFSADITLVNVTMTGNSGSNQNTITLTNGSLTVDNSIVYGNADTAITPDSVTPSVNNSDIQGGYAGTGNVDVDPEFIRDAGTNSASDPGDEHLSFDSPLAGRRAMSPLLPPAPISMANLRVVNDNVDMGSL